MHARNLSFAAAFAAPLLLLFVAGCSSDSGTTSGDAERLARTQTAAAAGSTATGNPTAPSSSATASGSAEPAPVLGGNVTKITPVHGAKVRQANTTSPDPNTPRGVCADVNFTDLPENFQWFRMVFDGVDVTSKLVLIASSDVAPKEGTICYSPVKGFSVGHHIAGVAVQSPRDPTATTRQIVQWSFDVVP